MTNVDTTDQSPVIISLCTGIRGLERGIETALGSQLRIAAFVEIEAFIIENLLAAMEYGLVVPTPIWSNLKTFPFAAFHGKVHGIIGGYPCQPFSLAGKRKGSADPRHLWPFIRKGIESAEPIWVFFENVDDHITMGFDQVYQDLRELGYLVEVGIYSAEEVGATHERQRLYIFGIRQEMAYTNGYDPGRIFDNILRTERKSISEKDQRQRHRDEPAACGEDVAHSGSIGIQQSGSEQQSELTEQDGIPGGNELENPGSQRGKRGSKGNSGGSTRTGNVEGSGRTLADAQSIGQQRHEDVRRGGPKTDAEERRWREWHTGTDTTFRGWPAGQGPNQHDWEEPRTVKSRLEYTVNGYNFIGDLHRAIGNGVVEQTAEKALIHLVHKHIKTMKHYGNR